VNVVQVWTRSYSEHRAGGLVVEVHQWYRTTGLWFIFLDECLVNSKKIPVAVK